MTKKRYMIIDDSEEIEVLEKMGIIKNGSKYM